MVDAESAAGSLVEQLTEALEVNKEPFGLVFCISDGRKRDVTNAERSCIRCARN